MIMELSALPRFPCGRDKSPRGRWGGIGEARDRWLYDHHWALVGVPTGGHSGFDVLDIDPEGLPWLRENEHRLPDTRTHVTRRRGLHLFFHAWPGLRCSVGRIAPGVDVRAEGGYIIWWPREGGPVEHPDLLAEWPDWLIDLALPKRAGIKTNLEFVNSLKTQSSMVTSPPEDWDEAVRNHKVTAKRFSREETYARSALDYARQRIARAPMGQRETTLNGESYAIGRLAGAGWISLFWCGLVLTGGMRDNRAVDPSTGKTFWEEHGRDYVEAKVRRALMAGIMKPATLEQSRS